MKVTAFSGSPREGGNTELILEAILGGAEDLGASVNLIRLNELNIRGCQACNWCKDHSDAFCSMKDDMQKVYREFADSDAVVIGTPVYMWQMSAQTKCMVDRLFGLLMPGFKSKIGRKKLILAFSQGAPEGAFDSYIAGTEKMFEMFGFSVEDTIVASGTTGKGSVTNDSALMEKAFSSGRSLVS